MAESKHRLLWMLNTRKGLAVLEGIHAHAPDAIALVTSYTDFGVREDYGTLIREYCGRHGVDFRPWAALRKSLRQTILDTGATGIVAVGWQYLVDEQVWRDLPDRLIVFHDSVLPRYRGFAPLATGMIKGDEEFGVTVLYAGASIDDGDIISQRNMHLGPEVYMADAIERMSELYRDAALALVSELASGTVRAEPQDESKATYSIWRGPEDCRVDWHGSARDIHNLVRAVGHPYPGAFAYLGERKVRIWRSEPLPGDVTFEIRDVGKIWRLEEGRPVVVCGEGLLRLTDLRDEEGHSLLPVTRLRQRFD